LASPAVPSAAASKASHPTTNPLPTKDAINSDKAADKGGMGGVHRPEEEENGRKAAPVVLRLFGVDVVADEGPDYNGIGFELRKSSSMPNLAIPSADPLLPHGEAGEGKRYASDDLELASRQQKRRRRKAQERKKGDFLFFSFSPSRIRLLSSCRGCSIKSEDWFVNEKCCPGF
jgi:hypothetical protein